MVEPSDPETELIAKAREGSAWAFTQLVRQHQAAVRGYIARHVRGRDAIDDIAQEIFIAALKGLSGYRGETRLRLWLLGIARNHVALYLRSEMRRRGREVGVGEEVLEWHARLVEADEPRLPERDREAAALEQCLRRLPRTSLDMLNSYYVRAENAAAIGQRVGKKENAIRMALLRMRQALRQCVRERLAAGDV